MKLFVLTTQTLHHAYFVRELNKMFPIAGVIQETASIKPAFKTRHDFEDDREVYEKKKFFKGQPVLISEMVSTLKVKSVNDPKAVQWMRALKPDVTIVFGTGKINSPMIEACGENMWNLHGGDPQKYRGLDSHLWAIYHKDFPALEVALHFVNARLDDGAMIGLKTIPVTAKTSLQQLRALNTEICLALVQSALKMFVKSGCVIGQPQKARGRYYSFMPACLKDLCVDNFKNYVRGLR